MEMMKRVLALLLTFAMLMPNLTTIASAMDTEDTSVITTEAALEPEETEEPAEQTEAPTEETQPPSEETEPSAQVTEVPTMETTAPEEEAEVPLIQEDTIVEELVADPVAMENIAEELMSATDTVEITVVPESPYSNDDMFAMYVDKVLYPNKPSFLGTGGYDNLKSDAEKNLYTYLLEKVSEIAANGGKAEFTLDDKTLEDMGFKVHISAAEMGIENQPNVDKETLRALVSEHFDFELGPVIKALLVDCPYALYWYDKTVDISVPYNYTYGYLSTGVITHVQIKELTISMAVAKNYAADNDSAAVSDDAAQATASVVTNAEAVKNQYAGLSDLEKLHAYKNWIMEKVSYDTEGAQKGKLSENNDPWQIIRVFDNDDTNDTVVCEGYAKAFQYLCDLSDFDGRVESFLVSGYAEGPHMWNIVSIDGRNYLVDVTNTDAEANEIPFGQDDRLFLAGASGSIKEGYAFTNDNFRPNTLSYLYYYEVYYEDGTSKIIHPAVDIYGGDANSILNLSDISYAEYVQQNQEQESYMTYRYLDNNGSGWFEDHDREMHRNIRLSPGQKNAVIVYINQWNHDTQEWETSPIHSSKLIAGEGLVLEPFDWNTDHVEENQNIDCFFYIRRLDGAENGTSAITYGNTDICLEVELSRHFAGFYRDDPTVANADLDSLWINEFKVTQDNKTFWFYYDPARDYEEGWSVGEISVTTDRESAAVTATNIGTNLWQITVSDDTVSNIYAIHSFNVQVDYALVNDDYLYVRDQMTRIHCSVDDFGRPEAAFIINGIRYMANRNYDGLFTSKQVGDNRYSVPASVEGVSYDIHSNTLTLDNAHLESLHIDHHWRNEETGDEGWNLPDSRFTIHLRGENTIHATNKHALFVNNEVHLTIEGRGSLDISMTGDGNNECHSAVEIHNSDVILDGEAQVTVSISGVGYENGNPAHMTAVRGHGENGDQWLRLRGAASLTTNVPEGVLINGYFDKNGEFVENAGFAGLHFPNIEINNDAVLNTQAIHVWDEGRGNASGGYYQNGGTVNISGIPYYEPYYVSENGDVGSWHCEGIVVNYGVIEINDGVLNVNMNGYDMDRRAIDVTPNGTIHFNGGRINLERADIVNRGRMYWHGTELNATESNLRIEEGSHGEIHGGRLHIQNGQLKVDNLYDEKHQFVQPGSLIVYGGEVNLDNSFAAVNGELYLEGGAILQSLDFRTLDTEEDFAQAFLIGREGFLGISGEGHLKINGMDKVDGICNNGILHQKGGRIEVDVDENCDRTGALFGFGVNHFENGYAYLEGHYGMVLFNDDDSGLYVSDYATVKVTGVNRGISTNAPVELNGGQLCVFADGDTANGIYPVAFFAENDSADTDARLTINGGSHYFACFEEDKLVPNSRGLWLVNAPVTLNGGELDVEAAITVVAENGAEVNVPAMISNENGAMLTLTDDAALNAKTLFVAGNQYACSVSFRTAQSCGDNVSWRMEPNADHTEEHPSYTLYISGEGDMYDYHMPINDPDSWHVAPWYVMADKITEVVVEEGVTGIGYWAFGRLHAVKQITYPASVNKLHLESNYDCPELEKIIIAEENANYYVTDNGKVIVEKGENGDTVIAAVCQIESYTAGENIVAIGMGAFDSTLVKKVDLSKSRIVEIGNMAFSDCAKLKEVKLSDCVTTIGLAAFQNSSLETIEMPASVDKIRNYAFAGCAALADVYYQGSEAQWNAIVIGYGNYPLTSLPITFLGVSEEEAGDPYLSYHTLSAGDQGYYEDMGEAGTDIKIPVGYYAPMVVYCNVWNPVSELWERWAVDPAQLYSDAEDLEIIPYRDYEGVAQEGEPNSFNFFKMTFHSGWGEPRNLCYQLDDGTELSLPVELARFNVGFYSADPTNMDPYSSERNEAWLNTYFINPNVSGEHSVYFALTEYDGDFDSVELGNWKTDEELDAPKAPKLEKINGSVYKITLSEELVRQIFAVRHALLPVTYRIGEETVTAEFLFRSAINSESKCYTFRINGINYEYYPGLEGYFSWDEENQNHIPYEALPGGITYDYDSDTLTMTNAKVYSLHLYYEWYDEERQIGGVSLQDRDFTLKLVGSNAITNAGSDAALYVGGGLNLTIAGEGSLAINATNAKAQENNFAHNAVAVDGGASLTIGEKAKVTVSISGNEFTKHDHLMGMWGGGNNTLTIKDDAVLTTKLPEGARDDGDAYAKGYEGIGWFGEIRVQDDAVLNTSTLSLYEYHDEHGRFRGKGSFIQTGGTTTIEALGFVNDKGNHAYNGFTIRGGTNALISGGKLIVKAKEANVAADESYDGFCGIRTEGHLEITGEDTLVEIQMPKQGAGVEVVGTEAFLKDGATLMVVGNGYHNSALKMYWGGRFQLQGGLVDIVDARVTLEDDGHMEIHEGSLVMTAQEYPGQTGLRINGGCSFTLHNGEVTVNLGLEENDEPAVWVGGEMHLNGGTMDVTGYRAMIVESGGNLHQNDADLTVVGMEKTLVSSHNGCIYLNGGHTEAILGEEHIDGGEIDMGGLWSRRSVSNVVNTWSSAVNVYENGYLEVNGGDHIFRVLATPGDDVWLGALDVRGAVNFHDGTVVLDTHEGGYALFHATHEDDSTVWFHNGLGAVSAEEGSLGLYYRFENDRGEKVYSLGTEDSPVSDAKILSTSAGSNSSWHIEKRGNDTVLIISGEYDMYNYYMPQDRAEKEWEKTPWFDYNDQITHVVVEEGIEHIGDWVFARMTNLVNVKLPESVCGISSSAFHGCDKLQSFTMQGNDNYFLDPATIMETDENRYSTGKVIIEGNWKVFKAAPSVTEYTVPQQISEIGNGAFQNCTKLTSIAFEVDENGWSNLWNIDNNAFEKTGLTEIKLPQGVQVIGRKAFYDTKDVTEIELSDTIRAIRAYAFTDCGSSTTTVKFAGNESQWAQIVIGSGNNLLDRVEFLCDIEEFDEPYLSFRWLEYNDGWEENNYPADREIYVPAGDTFYGVFYYNHWDATANKWIAEPVIPTTDANSGVIIKKMDAALMAEYEWHIADGEKNGAYFVRLNTAPGCWDSDDAQYGLISAKGVQMDIRIQREKYGFYSSPVASNETWLNEYTLNALKTNEFYFIYEEHDGWYLDPNTIYVGSYEGLPSTAYRIYRYSQNAYRIVMDPVFMQDAWEYGHSFRTYVSFDKVNDDGEHRYCESDLQMKPMDLGSYDAVFEINDLRYLYFAEHDAWMLESDPANDGRPGVAILPAGVSYNAGSKTLTLNDAKLNNLTLEHQVRDENGQPTGETRLHSSELTLELKGNNVIESGHRSALTINGGLNVTVTGYGTLIVHSHNDENNWNEDGQKYAFDTIIVENNSTLTIAGGNVTAEISGKGYWNNWEPAMPAALRGRNGSKLVISGGTLTTVVPENARDNAPGEVDFEDYYGTHAIAEFSAITVSGGELNTTSLYFDNGVRYEQTGGTVNITGMGHLSWQHDEYGNQYQNYHYNGLQIHEGATADISGGMLNITVTPEHWEHGSSSYYCGLNIVGGQVTIGDTAEINVTGAFRGNAIYVGSEAGVNGKLTMTGGTLSLDNMMTNSYMVGIEVDEDCSAQISGGTLNLMPVDSTAGIRNSGNLTIGGNTKVNLNGYVFSEGNLTVTDNAEISVIHAENTDTTAWDIVPGTMFNFDSGTINAKNSAFWIGGIMNIGKDAKLVLEDSDFNADGEITLNGTMSMSQKKLVDNKFLGMASDEWGNVWENYEHQSYLHVNGRLDLNGGSLKLNNAPMIIRDGAVVNQNGTEMIIDNEAVDRDERRDDNNEHKATEENDWLASINVNKDATLNINGGSIDIDKNNLEMGLNIRGTMNMRDGTLTIDTPDGYAVAARGPVRVSGGTMNLEGDIGYEQAWEKGFEHGKLMVIGGEININAVSGGIDAANNVVVTGGEINIHVSGRVDDFAYQNERPIHGLYGTGIVSYNNDDRRVSVSINGGKVNIQLPVNPQGNPIYEELQIFALTALDNGRININGGDVHVQGRVALGAESLTEGHHIAVNKRMQVLSLDSGNVLDMTSGVVTPKPDAHQFTYYIDTYEEDEIFTTPEFNLLQEGYATNLQIVRKSAGTNSSWDIQDGILTISAPDGIIGTMVTSADWNLVADKITGLVLQPNVQQPDDLSSNLFPNLQSVKTPCNTPAANFTDVTVELIHDLVDGSCKKCGYSEVESVPVIFTDTVNHSVLYKDKIQIQYHFNLAGADVEVSKYGALIWTAAEYEAELSAFTIAKADKTHYTSDTVYEVELVKQSGRYRADNEGQKPRELHTEYYAVPYAIVEGKYLYGNADLYSVQQYADDILTKSTNAASRKTVEAMMLFAKYTQQYLGDTGNIGVFENVLSKHNIPVNVEWTTADEALVLDQIVVVQPDYSTNFVAWAGTSLLMKDQTGLGFVLKGKFADAIEVLYWNESDYAKNSDSPIKGTESGVLEKIAYSTAYDQALKTGISARLSEDVYYVRMYNTATGEYSEVKADSVATNLARMVNKYSDGSNDKALKFAQAYLKYAATAKAYLGN